MEINWYTGDPILLHGEELAQATKLSISNNTLDICTSNAWKAFGQFKDSVWNSKNISMYKQICAVYKTMIVSTYTEVKPGLYTGLLSTNLMLTWCIISDKFWT